MTGKRYYDLSMSLAERSPGEMIAGCDQPGIMAAPHWHAQAEVNHVVRGWLDYEMHGHRVRLGAGDLALFWGGLPHRVADTAEDTLFHVYHLPLQHFFRLRLDAGLRRRVMRGATLLTDRPQAEDAAAFARWERMLTAGDARLRGHVMDELLLRLERLGFEPHRLVDLRAGGGDGGAAPGPGGQAVRRLCAFIADNPRSFRATTFGKDGEGWRARAPASIPALRAPLGAVLGRMVTNALNDRAAFL